MILQGVIKAKERNGSGLYLTIDGKKMQVEPAKEVYAGSINTGDLVEYSTYKHQVSYVKKKGDAVPRQVPPASTFQPASDLPPNDPPAVSPQPPADPVREGPLPVNDTAPPAITPSPVVAAPDPYLAAIIGQSTVKITAVINVENYESFRMEVQGPAAGIDILRSYLDARLATFGRTDDLTAAAIDQYRRRVLGGV